MLLQQSRSSKKQRSARLCQQPYLSDKALLAIAKRERRYTRTRRQNQRRKQQRQRVIANSLSKAEKHNLTVFKDLALQVRQNRRRAILLHTNGDVSQVRMLASTSNPMGVVGMFLGGNPILVASRKDISVGVMSLNDSVSDEPLSDTAVRLLGKLQIYPHVSPIHGRCLIIRTWEISPEQVLLGDLPLSERYDQSVLNATWQKEAAPDNSMEEYDRMAAAAAKQSEDDNTKNVAST